MSYLLKYVVFFLLLCVFSCASLTTIEYEWIHAPVNLQIKKVTDPFVGYEVTFYSNNIENNFRGYRLYQDTTKETVVQQQLNEFKTEKYFTGQSNNLPLSTTTMWCSSALGLQFNQVIRIQLGGEALLPAYNCFSKTFTPIVGNYLAVRAGVDRTCGNNTSVNCFPWSEAATVQIKD